MDSHNPQPSRIEKNDLRGYHAALKSFIIRCINIDGLSWRGQKNGVLLYPPDGTQPITVYCRNTDQQIRSLKQWYAAHVEPKTETEEPVSAESLAALADQVNDPNEHPVREADPAPEPEHEEWQPYLNTDGVHSEFFETDGVIVRCKVCVGTPTNYETTVDEVRGLGGHIRMNHRDTDGLRSPEAHAKSVDSRRYNRLAEQVTAAVELLAETIGYTPNNGSEQEVERLKHELEKETKRANDAEARLRKMREAFRGLE